MTITIDNLTKNVATSESNVVTGDGILDDLMETVTAHLEAQFKLGRITGPDYAKVYLGIMQSTLQAAASYTLGQEKANAESSLLFQKEITEFAQTDQSTKVAPTAASIMGTQALLSIEQAKGFLWNADQKYLKTLLDAWAINTSTAGVPNTGITAIQDSGMNTQISNAEPS